MYIVIAGGGKIGSYLAGIMLKSGNEVAVIEQRLATADRLSVQLTGPYLVIHGDGCDSRYQEDAGIRQADVFVATTARTIRISYPAKSPSACSACPAASLA